MPMGYLVAEFEKRRDAEHGRGPIHDEEAVIINLITPNRPLSSTGSTILMVVWIGLLLLLWSSAGAQTLGCGAET